MLVLLLLMPMVACARLQAAGDVVEDVTSPVVAQGVLLGVELPDGVDLSEAEGFSSTALCRLFLAYVADPGALSEAPVEGAEAAFRSEATGELGFRDVGDGAYELDAADGLMYAPQATAMVALEVDGDVGRMSVAMPEAAEFELPSSIVRQTALDIEVEGGPWANVAVATYDVARGRLTYDNVPTGVEEVYAFTHADGPVGRVTIPAEAFARKSTYVVAVAGMAIADVDRFQGLNTSLSAFIAGRASVRLLVVTE